MNKNDFKRIIKECISSYMMESSLPPGFTSSDIQTIDQYVNDNSIKESDGDPQQLLKKNDPLVSKTDMDAVLQKKAELGGKADWETPYIHVSTFKVVDENGKQIDLDKLKAAITQRPTNILSKNSKIQKSGNNEFVFFNLTLPSYKGLWYDEKLNEFKFVTTCPKAGNCKLVCYARKGSYIQFPSAFIFSAKVLNFLLNDWQGFKHQLINEIKSENATISSKNMRMVVRWHDSGDFFNEKYLKIALDIAKEIPTVIHYAYTKSVSLINKSNIPKNFIFNFSQSGQEDVLIKPTDKKSIIVPSDVFKDLFPKHGKSQKINTRADISPKSWSILKQRISQKYNLPMENILSYKELLSIPYNPDDPNMIPKYHVIVKGGDGDDSPMRKDVQTVLLFIH